MTCAIRAGWPRRCHANDTFNCSIFISRTVLDPISANGGEVLKFIGDAVLAIFPLADGIDDRFAQAGKALAATQSAVSLQGELSAEASEMGRSGKSILGSHCISARLPMAMLGAGTGLTSPSLARRSIWRAGSKGCARQPEIGFCCRMILWSL